MSVRLNSDLAKHARCSVSHIRSAFTATKVKLPTPRPEHGQQIYVFHQFQTNQVVYSLTKSLQNNAALRQLPFNGKKSVPRALRKDVWAPLATISFPPGSGRVGLSAFQKLREYRRLHELSWDEDTITREDGKVVPKKQWGRKLMDQKANSVADIAVVLGKVGRPEGDEIGLNGRTEGGEVPKVEVKWIDLLDAQFAETWTDNVVHDQLEWDQHNRAETKQNRELRAMEEAKTIKAQGRQNRELQAAEKAESIKAKKEEPKARKEKVYLAEKAVKHARYLEVRGITEEQYQSEKQELHRARLAEEAMTQPERDAARAKRKSLAEQAQADYVLRLEAQKAEALASYFTEKIVKHARWLSDRGITEEQYQLERKELARAKVEKKMLMQQVQGERK